MSRRTLPEFHRFEAPVPASGDMRAFGAIGVVLALSLALTMLVMPHASKTALSSEVEASCIADPGSDTAPFACTRR